MSEIDVQPTQNLESSKTNGEEKKIEEEKEDEEEHKEEAVALESEEISKCLWTWLRSIPPWMLCDDEYLVTTTEISLIINWFCNTEQSIHTIYFE